MPESIQHKLSRVRSPRVQITYDVEIGGAIQARELPFIMGIMADLSGMRENEAAPLKDRKFIEIDRDNFPEIMAYIIPHVKISVANKIDPQAESNLVADLYFKNLEDFSPINLVKSIDPLNQLLSSRSALNDLIAKLDGNDLLLKELRALATDTAKQDEILGKVETEAAADGPAETIAHASRMIKDETQLTNAKAMLEEFVRQVKAQEGEIGANILSFINQKIAKTDQTIGLQLDEILHDTSFQELEGVWKGLHFLVYKAETGKMLKLRLLNASKQALLQISRDGIKV